MNRYPLWKYVLIVVAHPIQTGLQGRRACASL